jgi:hypothetical protein
MFELGDDELEGLLADMEAALLAAALAGEADALAAAEAAELAGLARAFQATLLDSPAVPCPGARPPGALAVLGYRLTLPGRRAPRAAPPALGAGCPCARPRAPARRIVSSRPALTSASGARLRAAVAEQASAGAHRRGLPPKDEGVGRAATYAPSSRPGPWGAWAAADGAAAAQCARRARCGSTAAPCYVAAAA